jgi:hypothetical protein
MTSPFHRGLRPGIIEDCTACHSAHDFSLDGSNCALCHKDVDADSLVLPGRAAQAPAAIPAATVTRAAQSGMGAIRFASVDFTAYLHASVTAATPSAPARQEAVTFRHSRHQGLDCASCHRSTQVHGEITVATLQDCRACHHTAPLTASCSRCHDASDPPAGDFVLAQTMTLSVAEAERRELTFRHDVHDGLDCA